MGLSSALTSMTFEAFDPEGLAHVANIPLEQRLTKAGDFRGRITKLQGKDSHLLIVECNHPFVCSGVNMADSWNLSNLMGGTGEVRVIGAPIARKQCHVLPPGAEVHFCTSPKVIFTGLFVKNDTVRERAAALGCSDPYDEIREPAILNPRGEAANRYWRKLTTIREQGVQNGFVSSMAAGTFLHDMTNDYLVATMAHSHTLVLPRPRATVNRYAILRRAEEYLRENATRPVYMDELCAAVRVSERALEYAFNDLIGISPYNYLLALRLNRVRGELLGAPLPYSVKSSALAWGFRHLGRFSEHYKRLFGELPSETLSERINPRRKADAFRVLRNVIPPALSSAG